MLHGIFPKSSFLQKYGLNEYFEEISEAVKLGDIKEFEKLSNERMQIFINSGVYLAISKLKYLSF